MTLPAPPLPVAARSSTARSGRPTPTTQARIGLAVRSCQVIPWRGGPLALGPAREPEMEASMSTIEQEACPHGRR
jgi:hypothetical protein